MNASSDNVLVTNRKARFQYHILETLEAGVELKGTEVKSIKARHVSLEESFARVDQGQAWLMQMHVQPYDHGNQFNHDPVRPRRLLLHKAELRRLWGQLSQKGLTLVPIHLHLKRGRVKVLLGLGKGKDLRDKREAMKTRDANREAARAISDARRS